MPKFVDEQNAQQGCRKGPAGIEEYWIAGEPAPWPQVAVVYHRLQPEQKVVHEPGAVGGGGYGAGCQQQQRQAIFAEGRAHRTPLGSRREGGAAPVLNYVRVQRAPSAQAPDSPDACLVLLSMHAANSPPPGCIARSLLWSVVRFKSVQFLSWFEANCLPGGYAHLGAGAGIAADTGFSGADAENAKSAQFDALAGGQSLLEALKNRIHRSLCLGTGQARALDYMMDDVLLNQ